MKLVKVRIKELPEFVRSEWFMQLPVHPVSLDRVRSYQANPHARPEDVVLYYFESDDEIISFRTVFPAILNSETERFVWLSGAWTQPIYRKTGLARKLLDEVASDWNGRIMATNFSPVSRKLYEHSGILHLFYSGNGRRFYLNPDFKKLLQPRIGKLAFAGALANWLVDPQIQRKKSLFKHAVAGNLRWEIQAFPDQQCMKLANEQQSEFFFKRGEEELKWILAYPWLSTDDPTFEHTYPFSSYVRQYEIYTVKFFEAGEFVGFLIYSVRDGHLKLLHQHFMKDISEAIAGFLITVAVDSNVEMLTILDPALARRMQRIDNPFLFSKEFHQFIFSSWIKLPQNSLIQPAEGDFIFT